MAFRKPDQRDAFCNAGPDFRERARNKPPNCKTFRGVFAMSAPRKPSGRQFLVLRYLDKNPAQRTTAHIFNEVCGHAKVVRALFAHGFVQGDQVPARYVSLTDKGRAALAAMTSPSPARPPRSSMGGEG